jgi:hypothetical protein
MIQVWAGVHRSGFKKTDTKTPKRIGHLKLISDSLLQEYGFCPVGNPANGRIAQ